jgi:hypothetical protein
MTQLTEIGRLGIKWILKKKLKTHKDTGVGCLKTLQ